MPDADASKGTGTTSPRTTSHPPDKGESVDEKSDAPNDSPVIDAIGHGSGYWLLHADGSVNTNGVGEAYGDATEEVKDGGTPVAILGTIDDRGYGIVLADGTVVACGSFVAAETEPK